MRRIAAIALTTALLAAGGLGLGPAPALAGEPGAAGTAGEAPEATRLETVTLEVPDMYCPACPITVRKALEQVPGVVEAEASLETKTAVVTYDPTKTDVEALIAATTNVGYPSEVVK